MSDVTVHIDETLDLTTLHALQHDLCEVDGIDRINAEETRPHLMVISYDGKRMSSGSILAAFTDQGLHAALIGF